MVGTAKTRIKFIIIRYIVYCSAYTSLADTDIVLIFDVFEKGSRT